MVSSDAPQGSAVALSSTASLVISQSSNVDASCNVLNHCQRSHAPGGWDSHGTFHPAYPGRGEVAGGGKSLDEEPSKTTLTLSNRSFTAVALEGLPLELTSLSLAANSISSLCLSHLAATQQLTALILNSNQLTELDLSPLAKTPKLERLWLHNNLLTHLDLSPLAECKSLRSLYLDSNKIDSVELDLSPLSSCKLLRALRLGKNNLAGNLDITHVLGCAALSTLDVSASVKLTARVVPTAHAGSLQAAAGALPPALRRRAATVHWIAEEQEAAHEPPVGIASVNLARNVELCSKNSMPDQNSSDQPGSLPVSESLEELAALCQKPLATGKTLALMVGFRRSSRFAAQALLEEHGDLLTAVVASAHGSSAQAIAKTGALTTCSIVLVRPEADILIKDLRAMDPAIPIVVVGNSTEAADMVSKCLRKGATTFLREPLDQRDVITLCGLAHERQRSLQHSSCLGQYSATESSFESIEARDQTNWRQLSESGGRSYGPSMAERVEQNDFEGLAPESFSVGSSSFAAIPNENPIVDTALTQSISQCNQSDSEEGSAVSVSGSCDISSSSLLSSLPRKLSHANSQHGKKRGHVSLLDFGKLKDRAHGEISCRNNRIEDSAVGMLFARCGGRAFSPDFSAIATLCGLPVCAGVLLHSAAKIWVDTSSKKGAEVSPSLSPVSVMAFSSCNSMSRMEVHLHPDKNGVTTRSSLGNSNINSYEASEASHASASLDGHELPRNNSSMRSFMEMMDMAEEQKRFADGITYEMFKKFWLAHLCNRDAETRLYNVLRIAHRSEDGVPASAIHEIAAALVASRVSDMDSHQVRILAGSVLCYEIKGYSWTSVRREELRRCKLCATLLAAEGGMYDGIATQLRSDRMSDIRMAFAAASGKRVGGGRTRTIKDITWLNAERGLLSPRAVESLFAHDILNRAMDISQFAPMWLAISDPSSRSACEYLFSILDVDADGYLSPLDIAHFYSEKCVLLERDGFVPSSFDSVWYGLRDTFKGCCSPRSTEYEQISLMDVRRVGSKNWTELFQTLLFVEDELAMVDVRCTSQRGSSVAKAAVALF